MSARRKIGEERLYYSPPALRRQNQQQQQLKLNSTPSIPERRELSPGSYLDRFLEHTTPAVPARHFPKTSLRTWRERDNEFHPFFILGDLWEFFREWSVYGAGVPMVLNEGDSVVQYYVPSLSGIQLYIDPSTMEKRIPHDDGDANSSRETSSDGGSEYGTDKDVSNNQKLSNQHAATVQEHNELTGRNNPSMGSTVGGDISNPPGLLIFEYFEKELPFHREPLADKISILASRFPEIKTYRSCDLTPSSWVSVAWYPIYRIPVGPTLQNIDACFLTFHSLAKPVQSSERMHDGRGKLMLPTFGLVSYKFKASDWIANGVSEDPKFNSLLQDAANWLRSLQVDHPDYSFFVSHNTNWR
ncbi:uncharacterized protein [Primulina huaijiensis]|uniref:uncharacterized protein isoform X1 n=1 Tax=Primulina huaijiensis TaxID=1492673 RepID=UPI003CC719AC